MPRAAPRIVAPLCLECGKAAVQTMSQAIYPHRPDLWNRPMWQCACGAYVGCHAGTIRPKGRPAGKETRKARMAAHEAFDRLWQRKMEREGCSKKKARGAGYKWLAAQLGITAADCHIGEMTRGNALRVVQICRRYK